ncbi:Melanoma-associated antigen G1 [Dufourea novaeangliae]|uniref:Melanoma-associated antigen G1 n=2 Tax=Dufourea novaeangliae TaxID=178035 RepID=A0A154P7C8_DUFNO|nr:Melanoma-associated antigen G1 [Dufourea novaeangliae]
MNKARIIKSVFGGQGKNFHRVMTKARDLLSKIFGYQLVELEGSKYMLINEIRNTLPHVSPVGTKGSQQVLLFLVLTHIFMSEEFCTEESLWKFLENLGINCTEGQNHSYFGNVRHMVTEVFVAQKYIDKTVVEQNDAPKIEYKWGVRAEHEFSRRTALEFVSQIYNGRAINSWPLQYKALIAREKTNKFN